MRVVIIGNGIAGNTVASVLKEHDRGMDVTIISDEKASLYSAPALWKYLSGEIKREKVFIKNISDYSRQGINIIFGQKVINIDYRNKTLHLEKMDIDYDKLVIATGSISHVPAIEGLEKKGVFDFRSLKDADNIYFYHGKRAAVIASGLRGVEISIALKKRDCRVINVSRRWVLPRNFDYKPSLFIRNILEKNGIEIFTNETVLEICGEEKVNAVVTNSKRINCDMVIYTTSMKPNVSLASKAGIEIGRFGGIKVDKRMNTSIKDILACGDCIETKDLITGDTSWTPLWHNAKKQAKIAGYNLLNIGKNYTGSLKISSIDLFGQYAVSIGNTEENLESKDIKIIEGGNKNYYRLLISDGIPVGAQFIGKTEKVRMFLRSIYKKDNIEKLIEVISRKELLPTMLRGYIITRNRLERCTPYIGSF